MLNKYYENLTTDLLMKSYKKDNTDINTFLDRYLNKLQDMSNKTNFDNELLYHIIDYWCDCQKYFDEYLEKFIHYYILYKLADNDYSRYLICNDLYCYGSIMIKSYNESKKYILEIDDNYLKNEYFHIVSFNEYIFGTNLENKIESFFDDKLFTTEILLDEDNLMDYISKNLRPKGDI